MLNNSMGNQERSPPFLVQKDKWLQNAHYKGGEVIGSVWRLAMCRNRVSRRDQMIMKCYDFIP